MSLYTANGEAIPTLGKQYFTLNVGLNRTFSWEFLVARINTPILGADFLCHFDLSVHPKHRSVTDNLSGMTVKGVKSASPSYNLTSLTHVPPVSDINSKRLDTFPVCFLNSVTSLSPFINRLTPPAQRSPTSSIINPDRESNIHVPTASVNVTVAGKPPHDDVSRNQVLGSAPAPAANESTVTHLCGVPTDLSVDPDLPDVNKAQTISTEIEPTSTLKCPVTAFIGHSIRAATTPPGVSHFIRTHGPPVFASPRRLRSDKLQAAKETFKQLLELDLS